MNFLKKMHSTARCQKTILLCLGAVTMTMATKEGDIPKKEYSVDLPNEPFNWRKQNIGGCERFKLTELKEKGRSYSTLILKYGMHVQIIDVHPENGTIDIRVEPRRYNESPLKIFGVKYTVDGQKPEVVESPEETATETTIEAATYLFTETAPETAEEIQEFFRLLKKGTNVIMKECIQDSSSGDGSVAKGTSGVITEGLEEGYIVEVYGQDIKFTEAEALKYLELREDGHAKLKRDFITKLALDCYTNDYIIKAGSRGMVVKRTYDYKKYRYGIKVRFGKEGEASFTKEDALKYLALKDTSKVNKQMRRLMAASS